MTIKQILIALNNIDSEIEAVLDELRTDMELRNRVSGFCAFDSRLAGIRTEASKLKGDLFGTVKASELK
jgi:hypothetical protein